MFRRKKRGSELDDLSAKGPLPHHLAIIMDGNGRWARRRGLPRIAGHRAGMDAINRSIDGVRKLGIKYLTLFAFSTENWQRPKAEVDFLMSLPERFVAKELANMVANNVRFNIIGDLDGLPHNARMSVMKGIKGTAGNTGLVLTFAINYGAREEILRATRSLAVLSRRGNLDPARIDSELFESHLYTNGMPSVDMVIRTSGELRISNFMLWQLAYSELFFLDTLWPDFDEAYLYKAIAAFQQRQRRFGRI